MVRHKSKFGTYNQSQYFFNFIWHKQFLLLCIIIFEVQDGPVAQPSSASKDLDLEAGQIDPYTETGTGALQDIAFKCGTQVNKQFMHFSFLLFFFDCLLLLPVMATPSGGVQASPGI